MAADGPVNNGWHQKYRQSLCSISTTWSNKGAHQGAISAKATPAHRSANVPQLFEVN
jgi:hypothetical protein